MIRAFATLEDLVEALGVDHKEALALPTIPVKVGDCVVRSYDIGPGYPPLVIFGELTDPLAYWREEGRDPETLVGEDLEEYLYEVKSTEDSRKNGYWFGRWYSVDCIKGELGDAHASTFIRTVTRDEFEMARRVGWDVELLPDPGMAQA